MDTTPEQFAQNIKGLIQAIQDNGLAIAETMAITGKSLVQDRIQKEGLPGEKYSTNETPTWFMKGKEINQRGRKYVEENKTGTWGGFRQAQGLQSDYVDITYTGRMFGGIRPIQRLTAGNTYRIVMGGTDKEVDEKLYYNTERYGDFLEPNASEQTEIDEIVDDVLTELTDKFL